MTIQERRPLTIDFFRLFEIIRGKVEHEDLLIHQRTTGFITLQSVVFLTMAMMASAVVGLQFKMLCSILGFVSVCNCYFTFMSVRAAQKAIQVHRDEWDRIKKINKSDPALDFLPALTGGGLKQNICARGGAQAVFMPWSILFAWIAILCVIWPSNSPFENRADATADSFSEQIQSIDGD